MDEGWDAITVRVDGDDPQLTAQEALDTYQNMVRVLSKGKESDHEAT